MRNHPASLPPMTAHDHLAELVEDAVREASTPSEYVRGVFDAFRRFALVPIETLHPEEDPDDDMLLAQFGTYHFRGAEEFEVNLTRQIALSPEPLDDGSEPEDEDDVVKDLWQISCTLYWPASPATDVLGDGNLWAEEGVDAFFRDAVELRGWGWALREATEMPDLQIEFDPTD